MLKYVFGITIIVHLYEKITKKVLENDCQIPWEFFCRIRLTRSKNFSEGCI